jgi:long-chain acyl-CoA synthetase
VQLCEGYGLSEASPVTHANLPTKPHIGTIGLPLPDTSVRVVDLNDNSRDVAPGESGEMLISGPQVMKGYFADPEQTARALTTDASGTIWLHTGDIVNYDSDGYFHVQDRCKDMINHSGLKIYPCKVESVLRKHGQVADAAVVGRFDPVHTERVIAVVVPRGEVVDRDHLGSELRALCREHLAPYEVPSDIEFRDELPRSPLGKVLKKELRIAPVAGAKVEMKNGLTLKPAEAIAVAIEADLSDSNGNGQARHNGQEEAP